MFLEEPEDHSNTNTDGTSAQNGFHPAGHTGQQMSRQHIANRIGNRLPRYKRHNRSNNNKVQVVS